MASRAERHLEDAFCRASAMAASTKALSRVRARRRNAWVWSTGLTFTHPEDLEVLCLLDALREAEDLTRQLSERQKGEEVLRLSLEASLCL